MEKKYRDSGKGYREVAVLVSYGFGAGWVTWGMPEKALFDPIMVDFVEANKVNSDECKEYMKSTYEDCYNGGADDLYVHWVAEGKEFVIEEYDGAETLMLKEQFTWTTAQSTV